MITTSGVFSLYTNLVIFTTPAAFSNENNLTKSVNLTDVVHGGKIDRTDLKI